MPGNARKHGSRNLEAIRDSLRTFGQQRPIVTDADGVVVAGNGTLEAAKALGWIHVAAVRTELTAEQARAYSIADNRTGDLSGWDDDALRELLKTVPDDLRAVIGFNDQELADALGGSAEATEDDAVDPPETATTKLGDLWSLGDHRLICGSSLEAETLDRLLAGEKAHACITDPPYLVDYTGDRPGASGKDWAGVYNEIDRKDAAQFFGTLFKAMSDRAHPGAAFYCWHAHALYPHISAAWTEAGIFAHQQIIWLKPSPLLGRCMWMWRHEPCVMGWKSGGKCRFGGSQEYDTIWNVGDDDLAAMSKDELVKLARTMRERSSDVWEADWNGLRKIQGNHPTQKPVELIARPIRKHTRRGELCIEPFSGSGTCIIACEQTGRRCHAVELQPLFVDAAIMRWERFTGHQATLVGKGKKQRTFAEVCQERTGAPPCRPNRSGPADNPDAPA